MNAKLVILADAAKYDASCASSGGTRRDSVGGRGLGSNEGMGICHSYAPDGRHLSLLKILLTNYRQYVCLYCVNRVSSNVARARFGIDEVVNLTLDFYRRIHETPGQQEAAACAPWLEQEIALVRPRALVALGATAARSLLGRPVPVTKDRGGWLQRPDGLPVLVTLHPSALLRMGPQQQAGAFEEFGVDLAVAMAGPDLDPGASPG